MLDARPTETQLPLDDQQKEVRLTLRACGDNLAKTAPEVNLKFAVSKIYYVLEHNEPQMLGSLIAPLPSSAMGIVMDEDFRASGADGKRVADWIDTHSPEGYTYMPVSQIARLLGVSLRELAPLLLRQDLSLAENGSRASVVARSTQEKQDALALADARVLLNPKFHLAKMLGMTTAQSKQEYVVHPSYGDWHVEEILSTAGQGGAFSTIARATNKQTGQEAALKLPMSERAKAALLDEIEMYSKQSTLPLLRSIMPEFFDAGEDYLAMERLHGKTFDQFMHDRPFYSAREAHFFYSR